LIYALADSLQYILLSLKEYLSQVSFHFVSATCFVAAIVTTKRFFSKMYHRNMTLGFIFSAEHLLTVFARKRFAFKMDCAEK